MSRLQQSVEYNIAHGTLFDSIGYSFYVNGYPEAAKTWNERGDHMFLWHQAVKKNWHPDWPPLHKALRYIIAEQYKHNVALGIKLDLRIRACLEQFGIEPL